MDGTQCPWFLWVMMKWCPSIIQSSWAWFERYCLLNLDRLCQQNGLTTCQKKGQLWIRIKIASTTNSNAVVVFHILLCFPFFLACKERSCRSLQRNTIKYFYGIVLVTCVAWYLRPHKVRDRKRHKYHWPIAGDVHFGSRFLPEATKHIFRSLSNCLLDQNWCRPLK